MTNRDTPKTSLEWRGETEAREEFAKVTDLRESFNPELEIVGILQTALDRLTLDKGDGFKTTGLRIGTQKRIDLWERDPKVVVNHPDDFLRDVERYMVTHPESHADLHELADRINQWFVDNP